MLGVHPQTVSNYVAKGLLVESTKRDPKTKMVRILRASLTKLMDEGYDVIEQEKAIDRMRDELKETEHYLTERRRQIRKSEELLKIRDAFHDNVHAVAEFLAEYLAGSGILPNWKSKVVTEILVGRRYDCMASWPEVSLTFIRRTYNEALRMLNQGKRPSYLDLIEENKSLKAQLEHEKIKNETLRENQIIQAAIAEETIKIPQQLVGLSDCRMSVRLHNILWVLDVTNLYEVALMPRTALAKSRNCGRKSINELDLIMERYGLEYSNIDSLRNPKVQSLPGPFTEIPRFVLERRSKEIARIHR